MNCKFIPRANITLSFAEQGIHPYPFFYSRWKLPGFFHFICLIFPTSYSQLRMSINGFLFPFFFSFQNFKIRNLIFFFQWLEKKLKLQKKNTTFQYQFFWKLKKKSVLKYQKIAQQFQDVFVKKKDKIYWNKKHNEYLILLKELVYLNSPFHNGHEYCRLKLLIQWAQLKNWQWKW